MKTFIVTATFGMLVGAVAVALAESGFLGPWPRPAAAARLDTRAVTEPTEEERRLFIIKPGHGRAIPDVHVGEVLQITPFRYPVTPRFLGATLSVKIEGQQCAELVGQADTGGNGAGNGERSLFLLVRAEGKAEVHVDLLNDEGAKLEGYSTIFDLRVLP